MTPIAVLHIPHSSDRIPPDLKDSFLLSVDDLKHELLVMTDRYTDELFTVDIAVATSIRFPVSRLVLDPERFLDDTLEPMADRGMGVLYTRTSDGKVLRQTPTSAEREALVSRFYTPHHAALSAAIGDALDQNGVCLLLDCHSYPSEPIPCDLDPMTDRPDMCLGTSNANTPPWLLDNARSFLASRGLRVDVNRPYDGVLVPDEYSGLTSGVYALMIEINRGLYMDESTGERLAGFGAIATLVHEMVLRLINQTKERSSPT